jgi:hypothetical protein
MHWHIAPFSSQFPAESTLNSLVFEQQHRATSKADPASRLFPGCRCGTSCYFNQTWAGPSTGAFVLSVLQSSSKVRRIDVYGFNGNGDASAHVDFANKSIVSNCCTKCVFHATASDAYGNSGAIAFLGALAVAVSIVTVAVLCCVKKETLYLYRQWRSEHSSDEKKLPLIAIPVPEIQSVANGEEN